MNKMLQLPAVPEGDGCVLVFNKPLHWTSFDLVNKFRYRVCKHLGIKKLKVGHAGTLDPLATGVLVICTGRSTKKIESIQATDKEYVATIQLGSTTPSYDKETDPDEFFPWEQISEEQIHRALQCFLGDIEQIPPSFSACLVDGKRAYALARKGEKVKIRPRRVKIKELELLDFTPPLLHLRIVCTKGTYIRSLAHDIGKALESGAHLHSLVRTRVGDYHLDNAFSVEEIDTFLEQCICPKVPPAQSANKVSSPEQTNIQKK